jgi:hypothetical protein
MVSSGGGKTSDEIVYELAENILGKSPDNLDMDQANKALFEVKLYGENLECLLKSNCGSTLFSSISIVFSSLIQMAVSTP